MQNNIFLNSDILVTEDLGGGVTRQIMGYDPDIMMVKVMFREGSIGTAHSHPHVQTSYVVSGKFEVTIDGKKETLSEGEGFLCTSGKRAWSGLP